MNKFILALGDIHLKKSSLNEVKEIMEEVYYSQADKITEVWFLGDVINQSEKKPNPEILEYITKVFVDIINTGKTVVICIGNHEAFSDNSSTLDYLKHLGVRLIYHHGVIKVEKKEIYLGHHFTSESDPHFRDMRYKIKDLEKYDLALLGHDHKYQEFRDHVICLGSVRRIVFSESEYGSPKYLKIDSQMLKITPCEVKNAIPMVDISNIKKVAEIDSQTKVRLIFKSFEDFIANVNKLKDLEKKFVEFRVKHDYKQKIEKKATKKVKTKTFEESFQKYLKTIKNKEVRAFIKQCWEGK